MLPFFLLLLFAADPHFTTKADVDRLMKELSNWGRWGKDDQIGTVNLITASKRLQAIATVKEGVPVSLAVDVLKEKALDNGSPFGHTFNHTGANPAGQFVTDTYSVDYHGAAHTHMDTPGPHGLSGQDVQRRAAIHGDQ